MVEQQTFNLRVQGSSPCSGDSYGVESLTLFAVDSFVFDMCQVRRVLSLHLADRGILLSNCWSWRSSSTFTGVNSAYVYIKDREISWDHNPHDTL